MSQPQTKTNQVITAKGLATVFVGAFCLWVVGVSVSVKLAQSKEDSSAQASNSRGMARTLPPARMPGGEDEPPMELSPEIVQLDRDVQANPNDLELLITLAERLTLVGAQSQDPRLLMRAVEAYLKVLDKNPKHPEALLGLANVSFESGVFDRAADYYRQYLEARPEDQKARTDFSLTLIQIGETTEAISNFENLLKQSPKLFPARMGLALAYRVAEKPVDALKQAELAKPLAPDEEGRAMLDRFIEEVKNPKEKSKTDSALVSNTGSQTDGSLVSPAATVDQFFRKHPIVGPKVVAITWIAPERVRVSLREFPVEQMPEFAKQKFISNIQQMLKSLPEAVAVEIADNDTKKTLLEVSR